MPLVDPERALWEADMIGKYGDCGARHINTIGAWKTGVKPAKK